MRSQRATQLAQLLSAIDRHAVDDRNGDVIESLDHPATDHGVVAGR